LPITLTCAFKQPRPLHPTIAVNEFCTHSRELDENLTFRVFRLSSRSSAKSISILPWMSHQHYIAKRNSKQKSHNGMTCLMNSVVFIQKLIEVVVSH